MDKLTIAIDAMGGDHGLSVTVPAALKALAQHPNLHLILVGNSTQLKEALSLSGHSDRISIYPSSQVVTMDDPPSVALRSKKDSSMRVALDLVKDGAAQACVSAGNTGALMVIARLVLKTIPGVDRPAIIAALPTVFEDKVVRVLDLGANVDSTANNLYQFAVMGSLLSAAVDNIDKPKVCLLNIGSEEIKGNDQVKETATRLSNNSAVNYIGYVEGDEIFSGNVDVVVCDGFVGNVALKTLEGAAKLFLHYTRRAYTKNWWAKLSAIISKPVFRTLRHSIDPGRRNGASLLGLRGIVIKSHGGADANAFATAIHQAVAQVQQNVIAQIEKEAAVLLSESTEEKS